MSTLKQPVAARFSRSDLALLGVYWLVVAPIILNSYAGQYGWARALPGIAYTVLIDTAAVLVLVWKLVPLALQRRRLLGLAGLLLVFAAGSGLAYLGTFVILSGGPVKLSLGQVLGAVLGHAKSYGVLGILLVGKQYLTMQQLLLQARQAQTESELRQLKAQIDPHFLFNNLNILQALIQQDPAEASHYLSRFAGLYRYLIRHKDDDFVTLRQELQFADEYRYLLRHRFGSAYAFEQELANTASLDELFVVPGTVQLLLENAIKHNRGDEDEPLRIGLRVGNDELTVCNPLQPKLTPVDSTGTGLRNLRERYQLLAGRVVTVTQDEYFTVTVPVVGSS